MKRLFFGLCTVISIIGLAALALGIAGFLWYSPENGWCVGTLAQCLKP